MPHKKILLREDIEDLGARGEVVRVKSGYARNYLLPRKLAVEATASNVKQIESERAALLKREAKDRAGAEAQAQQMRSLSLTFERKIGEQGMLYGSVTSMDVVQALKDQGYEIDRRRITLKEPFKTPGEFTVPVRLHREVVIDLPVKITGEGGSEAQAAVEPVDKDSAEVVAPPEADGQSQTN
jgi:large subunit ribosomal protein L9